MQIIGRGESTPNADYREAVRQGTPVGVLSAYPAVEARSADDPGSPAVRLIYTTPIGCRSLQKLSMTSDALSGSRG